MVPGRRREPCTIGRHSNRNDWPAMALENLIRLLATFRPDRYPCVRSGSRHTPVLQEGDSVHGIRVKPKDLLRGLGLERPADGGGVEAAGQHAVAIAGNRNGSPRPT